MSEFLPVQLIGFSDELLKISKVITPLKEHQQRVVDRIQQSDQPGLVVVHGLGSGKTLTSIAAADALGQPTDVVVPAALQGNYKKELKKHVRGKQPKTTVQSMQNLATKGTPPKGKTLIVDEAHRARDHQTATFQTLKKNESEKRLLLTGSPFYNHPADLAPLIDMAANQKVLPFDRDEFTREFITEKVVKPSVGQRLLNNFRKDENKVKPGTVPVLYEKNAPKLRDAFHKWVDYHPGSTEGFPTVSHSNVDVEMSPEQLKVYDTLMGKAPAWVAWKVKRGLPPSKQESQQLNAFLTAVRQASNTTLPFVQPGTEAHDPKIQRAFDSLKKHLDENPRHKAVVYSNYLDAGINPYKSRLDAAKIPYGEFTGAMSKKKRDALVQDYNQGKIRALLLSSAGGEGLDLKGTRLMQILEPHWNEEKLKQVEGRGARYLSHADLPEDERKLLVERYRSVRPQSVGGRLAHKLTGRPLDKSVDEYLSQMSEDKEKLIQQFRDLLPNQKKVKTSSTRWNPSEDSKDLANSWKPRAARFAAYTLPTGITLGTLGHGLARVSGASRKEALLFAAATGAVGSYLGHTIGKVVQDPMSAGKVLARQAVRNPQKENALRDQAGKMDWGEVAKSTGRHLIGATPAVLVGKKVGPAMALGLGSSVIGAIGSGYLDKYQKMIAVNELDNARAAAPVEDARKLQKLRSQVAKLEATVEGDGWKTDHETRKPEVKKTKSGPKTHEW